MAAATMRDTVEPACWEVENVPRANLHLYPGRACRVFAYKHTSETVLKQRNRNLSI